MAKLTKMQNVMLIEGYINENYDLRFNEISKNAEIKSKDKDDAEFRTLGSRQINTIVREVQLNIDDVSSVKSIVDGYVNSEALPSYNPIRDYLNNLPEWDGEDRFNRLFMRLPGITPDLIQWMITWFLSMVAHWQDLDTLHGNECVPVLIGEQGCGKTTFAQRILPPHLRSYFMDHLNLSNKFDKEMALTNNLLVNIDELDQVKQPQQCSLKQTLSKTKVNGRPIYGKVQEDRVRYASFIATTNNLHPLNDPTGSRRYICVPIKEGELIDNDSPVEHDQLYAQALSDLKSGVRYWFDNKEAIKIQQHNAPFQAIQNLDDMILSLYSVPKPNEQGKWVVVKDILAEMRKQFPTLQLNRSLTVKVGLSLKELGFEQKYMSSGSCYNVKEVA